MGGLAAGVVQPEENEDDGDRDQNQSQRAQSHRNDEYQQHSNVRMKDGTTDDDTEHTRRRVDQRNAQGIEQETSKRRPSQLIDPHPTRHVEEQVEKEPKTPHNR